MLVLRRRERLGLGESCIVEIAEAFEVIEHRLKNLVAVFLLRQLSLQFRPAVEAALKDIQRFVKAFLPYFALLDLRYLFVGKRHSLAQPESRDDIEIAAERECAVQENIPSVFLSPLFGNAGDRGHIHF
jgi:hypothetical protein